MDELARIKKLEDELQRAKSQIETPKNMLTFSQNDCNIDSNSKMQSLVFEGKFVSLAKVIIDFYLPLGSVKVFCNGIFLSELKAEETTECLQIGLKKGDNEIAFDLSNAQEFKINKLEVFGFVSEKDFGSKITSLVYGDGAFLGIYNGVKKNAELKYVTGEYAVGVWDFNLIKFFAMSKLENVDKAILIAAEERVFTCYLLDLANRTILSRETMVGSFNGISGIKNGSFLAIESDGSLQKYTFNENFEYESDWLGIYAKKVISSPNANSYIVIDSDGKATLYRNSKTSLQKAENYSLIIMDGQDLAVFTVNNICYRQGADGTLTPIAYGDEVASLYGGKIAVRQKQNVKIIHENL